MEKIYSTISFPFSFEKGFFFSSISVHCSYFTHTLLTMIIWIIWDGQLAKMTLEAAQQRDDVHTYIVLWSDKDTSICKDLCDEYIEGSLYDPQALQYLASRCDILTYDIEHIHVQALLDLETQGQQIIPSPQILQIIQDKGRQKQFYTKHALPTAAYVIVDKREQIREHLDQFLGDDIIIKSCTWGYDGRGVIKMSKKDLIEGAVVPQGFGWKCLLEQCVPFLKELAVIVARDQYGTIATYDVCDMVFNEAHMLDAQICPADIAPEITQKAQQLAQQAVVAFWWAGLFAVEMFLTTEYEILINEIAPRPHNSGHHSIEASETSQFAQLLRVCLWKEVWSIKTRKVSWLVNVLWPDNHVWSYTLVNTHNLSNLNDVHIHMYGKSVSRPKRKLGHITVLAHDHAALQKKLAEVKKTIYVEKAACE